MIDVTPDQKTRILNVKVTEKERQAIIAMAEKYAKGNVSLWLRYAATHFVPKERL